jgi:hypothetical protein
MLGALFKKRRARTRARVCARLLGNQLCLHAGVCRQLRAGRDARTQVAMSEMAAFSAQQRAAKQAAHATVIQKVFRGGRVRRMIKVQRRAAARVLLLLPLLLPV